MNYDLHNKYKIIFIAAAAWEIQKILFIFHFCEWARQEL